VTSYGPYSLNGINYNSTGVYEQHILTVHGCDSMITINLNFLENSIEEINFEYIIYPNPVTSKGLINISPSIPIDVPINIISLDGKIIPVERFQDSIIAPTTRGIYFLIIGSRKFRFIVQ
jgi:hypothetical protein